MATDYKRHKLQKLVEENLLDLDVTDMCEIVVLAASRIADDYDFESDTSEVVEYVETGYPSNFDSDVKDRADNYEVFGDDRLDDDPFLTPWDLAEEDVWGWWQSYWNEICMKAVDGGVFEMLDYAASNRESFAAARSAGVSLEDILAGYLQS